MLNVVKEFSTFHFLHLKVIVEDKEINLNDEINSNNEIMREKS